MKKVIALILTLVYLSTSSGMVLNVQYCMGELSSVKVEGFSRDKCKCAASEKSFGCCSNEYKVAKIKEPHAASIIHYSIDAPVANTTSGVSLINYSPTLSAGQLIRSSDSSPPLRTSPHIYIKNCVFRI
jgi:hypothetical protein